jgi:hypothetical protein
MCRSMKKAYGIKVPWKRCLMKKKRSDINNYLYTDKHNYIDNIKAKPSSPLFDVENEPKTSKIRSLREIYEATSELHLVCVLMDVEDITFEQTIKDEKWQAAMQEEMKAIEKNNT